MPTFKVFKETSSHVICKYSFLVLIFSFFTALEVGLIEPMLKKAMNFGEPEEHVVKKGEIIVKGIIFVVGITILFVLFQGKLVKCATGI